ncbi:carboxylesterase/lipase family protein [Pseudomonas sp. MYb185]|uniref:carboxylesterase/lipase family protein n=1 Tax=Pseudomonas sp. MYb185 TaxID=1848729 RepID=UPI001304B3DD|nr:carboxylesterase family protein [Pseudomonas sp. MYb185]
MVPITKRAQRMRYHLVPVLTALTLTGCLGGGGGGGGSNPVTAGEPRADTAQGQVQGVQQETLISFKGIPYAAAPLGELRFSAPQPPPERDALLVADQYATPCLQAPNLFETAPSSEDCLYLNVYTPDLDGEYPVMVWIHGGSLENGSGGPTYDPQRLVERGITAVTINYRLGVPGFLAHPALSDESPENESGNYGIMDQQAALAWLRANIGQFGGDPANITLFGESAGGHSVLTHLVSPGSSELFDKAIVQSGSYAPNQRTLAEALARGEILAEHAGCTGDNEVAACLRALSADQLIALQQWMSTSDTPLNTGFMPTRHLPVTGTSLLPASIAEALQAGSFNRKPVLIGGNLDEWRFFVGLYLASGGSVPEPAYETFIQITLGVDPATAAQLALAYPAASYDSAAQALSALGTDAIFACNTLAQVRHLAADVDTYFYEFADRNAPLTVAPVPGFDFGAAHALEIGYLLASEDLMAQFGATDAQIELAEHMADYWTSFATYGDPNPTSGTSPMWNAFVAGSSETMLNLVPPEPGSVPAAQFDTFHQCDAIWLAAPVNGITTSGVQNQSQ